VRLFDVLDAADAFRRPLRDGFLIDPVLGLRMTCSACRQSAAVAEPRAEIELRAWAEDHRRTCRQPFSVEARL
jgi:hypothetical protein